MKLIIKQSLFFLLITSSNLLLAQDTVFIKKNIDSESLVYQTDTLIFSSSMHRNILVGTTKLTRTTNQIEAIAYGLYFDSIAKSQCKNHSEEVYKLDDKINTIEQTDSSIFIDFNLYDNCCFDFLCDYSVDSSGILNLIYKGYGSYCACRCCFGLSYYIKIEKGEDIKKLNGVILNGDAASFRKLQPK